MPETPLRPATADPYGILPGTPTFAREPLSTPEAWGTPEQDGPFYSPPATITPMPRLTPLPAIPSQSQGPTPRAQGFFPTASPARTTLPTAVVAPSFSPQLAPRVSKKPDRWGTWKAGGYGFHNRPLLKSPYFF
jgi:hypothetical protein